MPGYLPYSADVHRYFRLLAEASPRVRVVTIGTSEEGRDGSRWRSPRGEPPGRKRTGRVSPSSPTRGPWARRRARGAARRRERPRYYITGAITTRDGLAHRPDGAADRLAVDESPYVRKTRDNLITPITPVVEVDGRDRMVDVYRWHLAQSPIRRWPRLAYWGRYVAHDNNRDAMGMTLSLTRNVLEHSSRLARAGPPRPARIGPLPR